ncbi:MAG: potassium transporter TrkH [Polyangiaceae bacterium]|nr:potassium transporter TrkH [Polyangiaceae bacterium]
MAASPALPAIAIRVYGKNALDWDLRAAAVYGTAGVWLLSSLLLRRAPRVAALLVTLGFFSLIAVLLPSLVDHPAIALTSLMFGLGAVLGLHASRELGPGMSPVSQASSLHSARMASATALTLWVSIWPRNLEYQALLAPWLAGSFLVAIGWVLVWAARALHSFRWRLAIAAGVASTIGITLALGQASWSGLFSSTSALLAMAVLALPRASGEAEDWLTPLIDHPARLLVSTFAFLCLAGTLLLLAPWATAGGTGLTLSAAAFTSISAVCVTGLTVIDPGTDLSFAGQLILLLLFQTGGLGIMTFSTAALRFLGRRLSLRHEAAVAGLVSPQDRSQVFDATLRVIRVTLACEGIGALVLGVHFVLRGESLGAAAWDGLFTAVSAFCNAGFSLHADSLISFQRDPIVLHTVSVLIILGGLSPALVVTLPVFFGRRREPIRAQKRLVLAVTLILLFGGALLFSALEWRYSLAGLPALDRLHNAWVQSTVMRTAGFNSVDIANIHPATFTMTCALMFVGGSPGSTAGGIKTTTLGVLVLAVVTAIRGRRSVVAFGRTIPHETVYRAAAITMMGLLSLGVAFMALQLTQRIPDRLSLFEVVSALGTVGLTLGATPLLDDVGRVIIGMCMFMGRVGPLTFFMLIGERRTDDAWKHPVEEIDVG